ncbi:MAG: hypothetical protein ACR2OH_00700, partial [Microthrixaceae bacterium]
AGAPGTGAPGTAGAQPWTATDGQGQPEKKRSPVPIIIAVVIALLAAVAVFLFVSGTLGGGDGDVTIADGSCDIAADGTLSVSGTYTSGSEVDTSLDVRFDDQDGNEADKTSVDVKGDADEDIAWSASGQASDDVTKVSCTVSQGG